jgi:hypothetical protein
MKERSPLPPEPVSTGIGKILSLMLATLLLLVGVACLAVIWDYGDLENLLRIMSTFMVLALLTAGGLIMWRRQ